MTDHTRTATDLESQPRAIGDTDQRAIVLLLPADMDRGAEIELTSKILELSDDRLIAAYGWPANEVYLKPCSETPVIPGVSQS